MIFNIDLTNDLIDLIWVEIDNLIKMGFKFMSYKDWEKNEEKKIYADINRKKQNGEDIERDKERLKKNNLKNKYKMDQVILYFNFRQRIPSNIKRNIKYSSKFICPEKHKDGLQNLINKIKNGISLFPHLSRQIFKPKSQDGMLFDFGINHLHLGIKPDEKNPLLVEGDKEIIYCMFDDKTVYFIVIDEHGKWADEELLRIVKQEFPNLIDKYKFNSILGIENSISESDRLTLRKSGITTFIEIDGEIYMSPGGGINTAGGSTMAVMKMNNHFRNYNNIEKQILHILNQNHDEIDKKYNHLANEFNFKMIDPEKIILEDEVSGVKLFVELNNTNKSIVEKINLEP